VLAVGVQVGPAGVADQQRVRMSISYGSLPGEWPATRRAWWASSWPGLATAVMSALPSVTFSQSLDA